MIDNYDLWEAHDREEQERLDRMPLCECCNQPIQDEYCYEINGEVLCEDCLVSLYRKDVEDVA